MFQHQLKSDKNSMLYTKVAKLFDHQITSCITIINCESKKIIKNIHKLQIK
jgi:hypothetical protein